MSVHYLNEEILLKNSEKEKLPKSILILPRNGLINHNGIQML